MKYTKRFPVAWLIALGLLAVLLAAGVAYAAPWVQGEFTLPYEVHWGNAVLPPDEYLLTVDCTTIPMIATIRSKDGKRAALVMTMIADHGAQGESALLIVNKGNQSTVHSLRLAKVGLVLIYDPKLAREDQAREARGRQAIPVFTAKR